MKKLLLPLLFLPLLLGFAVKTPAKVDAFGGEVQYVMPDPIPTTAQEFIDYWELVFRKDDVPVCEISRTDYQEMITIYKGLSEEDKELVNIHEDSRDEGYTIKQIIQTLVNKYYPNNSKIKESKPKLDQSSIIIIATIVALVGATAISVLYILKNNKVIK